MHVHRIKRAIVRLTCAALIVSLLPVLASGYPFVGYTTDDVRLRKQPSTAADILAVIPSGEALLVSGADGDFYIVEYEGRSGYVMKSFLSLSAPQAGAAGTPVPASAQAQSRYVQLSGGDTGLLVRALQDALKELSFYDGEVDGKYGSGTMAAVRAFQQRNGLPANGVADPVTQERLFEGRPVNAFGRQTGIQTLPVNDDVIMRPGSRGELVSALQQQLQALGLYRGAIDGRYGSGTENAVRAFQQANRLRADGIAGANTRQALAAAVAQALQGPAAQPPSVTQSPQFVPEEAEATYPYTTTASASVNMRRRPSVRAQRILTVPAGAAISVLKSAGDFLYVSYRSRTGYVMAAYVDIPPQYLPGRTLPHSPEAQSRYERLESGASGPKVRALQQALQELGFFSGAVDGVFGTKTLTAVKAFQKQNGLRETGVMTAEAQKMLYEERCRNARNRLVYVATLPPVDGWPMQQGDRGDAVVTLQDQLRQLGHYGGASTGEYTRETTLAVRAFQKAHSIRETGKVDQFTLLAVRTAVATPAPPTDGGYLPPASTPLTEDNVIVIRSGTRGLPVIRLQERLVELGYYQITPDGIYNANDIAALRAFQRANGLTVTGVADLGTQLALYAPTAIAAQSAATPTPSAIPAATPVPTIPTVYPIALRVGMNGEAVRAMQQRLITLGFLTGRADGIFGTQTAAAVSAFQRAHNLRADGIAGQQTLTQLYGASAQPKATPTPAQTAAPTQPPQADKTTLRVGDTGDAVRSLQRRLIQLGYLAGGADGIFGPKTSLAVRSFQTNNRLTATGIADPITIGRVNSPNAVAATGVIAPPPVTPPIGGDTGFRAPAASEVRFADWYTEIRSRIRSMPNIIIYDFATGAHYNVKVFSVGRHADGEPVTRQDTEIMEQALGYNNWTPRAVWVIFSDGRVYMASTHSHGHEVDHNSSNGLNGHICVHFPRTMEDAMATGPYAVSHQNAILAGWDLTMNMAR